MAPEAPATPPPTTPPVPSPATPATGATPPPATPPSGAPSGATPPEPKPDELGDAGKRALDAERKARGDAEKAAKAANAELEKLRKSTQTDHEKAVDAARSEGEATATKAFGERLAAAKIEAALTGVVPDPAGIVEDLALSKYVTDAGEPDGDAITKLREKYAALGTAGTTPPPAVPGVPAGARPDNGPTQLSRADLKNMSPDQIVTARKEGRLRDVTAGG